MLTKIPFPLMLKGNMSARSDGFTAVEMLVTLLVAGTFVMAFFQLFSTTNNISQMTKEEAYAVNDAMTYSDENKYRADGATQSGTTYVSHPETRGYNASSPGQFQIVQGVGVRVNDGVLPANTNLYQKEVTVNYNLDKSIKLTTFIRFTSGLYYGK